MTGFSRICAFFDIANMADCIPDYKDAVWSFYRYEPSIAGAVIFCILLGLTSGLHAFQLYTTRTWYLSALVVGGLCEFPSSDAQHIPRIV